MQRLDEGTMKAGYEAAPFFSLALFFSLFTCPQSACG
jgi:hypothetical protein